MILNKQEIESILNSLISHQEGEILSYYLSDTVESTNQTLWELLATGINPPLAVIASQQTAGRGQWGRIWQSEVGGLYLSLALSPNMQVKDAAHITLFTAWGIARQLRSYQIPVLLKWPNDLVLGGKKLGGIKSETKIQRGIIKQTAIGVGINWSNPVPDKGINLKTWLQHYCEPSINSLEMLAALTIAGILAGYQYYLKAGIEVILESYLKILQSLGKSVIVNGSPGVVVGVTSQAELRVRLQSPGATTEITLPPGMISLGY